MNRRNALKGLGMGAFGALGFKINKSINVQAGYLRHRSGDLNLNRLQVAVFLNTGD